MDIPHVQLIRQTAPQPAVADVAGEVRKQWLASKTAKRIKPGMRVAVGCGSRGIKNYLAIAKATIDVLKELGAQPVVVSAMGSHGGATPDGQREVHGARSLRPPRAARCCPDWRQGRTPMPCRWAVAAGRSGAP